MTAADLSRAQVIVAVAIISSVACYGCGKKGPPLPPLVRLPVSPAGFSAQLRGATVDLQFTVPATNTDNSRPANIQRVDVYAVTSSDAWTDEQIIKRGKRVASVAVKAPRDPDDVIEEDDPPVDMAAPEGHGLDQGAIARVSENLDSAARAPVSVPTDRRLRDQGRGGSYGSTTASGSGPLVPPRSTPLARSYVAVGVSTHDRHGPFSKRIAVPLVPAPPAPTSPTMAYDEKAITVQWKPVASAPPIQLPPAGNELPSTPIGVSPVAIRYNVYDVTATAPNGAPPSRSSPPVAPLKLNMTPIAELAFSDARIVWGERRCYVVRAVETFSDLTIESDAAPATCETLVDTFPPAPPANLQSSPQEGAVTLIWDANTEQDLDGYVVLRGASADALQPITAELVHVTQFRDEHLEAGVRFTYAVKAVDKAGNISAPSNKVEEAAR
ncbi:MAG TPA: hypothetical protein VMS04_07845 [Vicinamibacterales bacterium]|nr:hypothetical protein [Vicinamibacterales bacterium]